MIDDVQSDRCGRKDSQVHEAVVPRLLSVAGEVSSKNKT
jgi:hypothetical protein